MKKGRYIKKNRGENASKKVTNYEIINSTYQ